MHCQNKLGDVVVQDPVIDLQKLEQPFWEPIGQFVIHFGYLEKTIDLSIASLLGLHHRQGEAVASQVLNLRSRIRLIEKLCYLATNNNAHRKAITEIIEEIIELNSYRNGLLHGSWGAYHMPTSTEHYWAKLDVNPQNFKYREFKVKLSELLNSLQRITEVNIRLSNSVQSISAELEKRSNASAV